MVICPQAVVSGCVLIVLGAISVVAQPLSVTPASFVPDLSEPGQRAMSNYTGFKFTISKADVSQRLPATAVACTCVAPVVQYC